MISDTAALGVPETAEALVSSEHVRRIAGTIGDERDVADGSELPLLWHWAFFTPTVAVGRLGVDGHPRLAPDGLTAGLPRRMWAGGSVTQHAPLIVGETASRRSKVTAAERKTGRSGDLLVVVIEHKVFQGGVLAVSERQDLIYRPAGEPVSPPQGDTRPVAPDGGWSEPVVADPVTLFRFSALTFNSHRIHYDLPYARDEEGYPALVVHGPLTALLLAGAAERHGHRADTFEFRATAPLFAGSTFWLVGEPDPSGVALRAVRTDGTVAMTGRLDRELQSGEGKL